MSTRHMRPKPRGVRRVRGVRRAPGKGARHAVPRAGMTIVELMVAILVLSVGLLSMAGFSFTMTKQFQASGLQGTAALVVQSRLDSIASVKCSNLAPSGPVSGTAVTLGVTEKWTISDGNDIKIIVDTVSFAGRKNPLVYQSIIPCRD